MKQINLIPLRELRRQRLTLLGGAAVVGMFLGLAATATLYGLVTSENESYKNRAVAMVRLDEGLSAADTASIARINQLNALGQSEINWSRAFVLVGSLIPQDVTLTGYSYATSAAGVTLKLNGTASSNLGFASFVRTLQADTALSSPKVESYAYTPATGAVSFSVSALVLPQAINYQTAAVPKGGTQ